MGMVKPLVAIVMVVSAVVVAGSVVPAALAQTPATPGAKPSQRGEEKSQRGEEKIVQGQVKSIDPTGTELTLTDGMRLVAPPGAMITPGAVTEGMAVIASYREENGENVLTALAVEETSASPRSNPRSPDTPSSTPPRESSPRN
jgi:hypothetical protein